MPPNEFSVTVATHEVEIQHLKRLSESLLKLAENQREMTHEAQKTLGIMQLIQNQHTETFVKLQQDVASLKETRIFITGSWKALATVSIVAVTVFKAGAMALDYLKHLTN